jgi:hypothetical protein
VGWAAPVDPLTPIAPPDRPAQAGANSVRVFLHGHSTYTPEFDSSGFVISPDGKQTLLDDLRRYLRGAQQLGLLVTLVLWDAAALSNTSGEYALFGSVPKLTSYIDNVLTPMVQALADEPVSTDTAISSRGRARACTPAPSLLYCTAPSSHPSFTHTHSVSHVRTHP